jgi:hypothetical protein
VEAIATADEVADDLASGAVVTKADDGLQAIDTVHADVVYLEEHLPPGVEAGVDYVLNRRGAPS